MMATRSAAEMTAAARRRDTVPPRRRTSTDRITPTSSVPGCVQLLRELVGVRVDRLGDIAVDRLDVGSDLVGHVRRVQHDQPRLALVQHGAELPKVVVAHAILQMPGDGAHPRAYRRAHTQADARQDRCQRADRQTRPRTVARRLLVLVHHLDLAVVAALQDRGVERVPDAGGVVELLHRFVIGLRIRNGVVGRREDDQHVLLAHRRLLRRGSSEAFGRIIRSAPTAWEATSDVTFEERERDTG